MHVCHSQPPAVPSESRRLEIDIKDIGEEIKDKAGMDVLRTRKWVANVSVDDAVWIRRGRWRSRVAVMNYSHKETDGV